MREESFAYRKHAKPPNYHLMQLIIYMKVLGRKMGVLLYENKNSQVGYFSKIEQILHYCQDNVIYGRPARTNLIGSTYTHVQVAGNLERCS